MQTTTRELQQSLSSFTRDYDGYFSSGIKFPMDGQVHRTSYAMTVTDINGIQWWFTLDVSSPGFYSVAFQDGLIRDIPEITGLTLQVKYADQEEWKAYNLTSHIQDVSVPVDLTNLFTRVMTSGLYVPLERTEPQAVKKPRKYKPVALVGTCSDLMEAIEDAGYTVEPDFHDEPVFTVAKDGEVFIDMYVYLEFKELDGGTEEDPVLVLTGGTQETLSQKENAGEFDTRDIETAEELLKALAISFADWETALKRLQ